MRIEHSIYINASPESIFGIYEGVSKWSTWDQDTKQSRISGPFQAGTRGELTPTVGATIPMLLTKVIKNKSFTIESKIPFFRMVFEHELHAENTVTEVVHRVIFSGLLSRVIGPVIVRRLNSGLPVTLGNLKKLAESQYITQLTDTLDPLKKSLLGNPRPEK